jgi:CUB/sushi domain-containing protein
MLGGNVSGLRRGAPFLALLALLGCSDDPAPCEAGSSGCACLAELRCTGELVCLSGICVGDDEHATDAGGRGGSGGSGSGGSGGMDARVGPPPDAGDATTSVPNDGGDAGPGATDCAALEAPANGSVSVPALTAGTVADYGCEASFGLVGSASRTCQSDGTWSGEAPSCAPGDCPSLMSPEHGTVTTADGTAVGAAAVFACEAGYQLVGDATRACQADNTWSGTEPQCVVVDCGALVAPDLGAVDTAAGTSFGATATYSCSEGHVLSDVATRSCQADGLWSGAAPLCEAVDCGALSAPASGSVDTTGGTLFGAVAMYGCMTGYGLVGVGSRTCQADGTWSDAAPSCAIGDCSNLPKPANGTVTTPTGTTFGAVATYACDVGYNPVGATTRTCQGDRTWSGTAATCAIVSCPALTAPTNGTITAPGNTYGRTVSYGCKVGHYLSGNATRTCQATGSWTGSNPTCPDANTEGLRLTRLRVGGTNEFVTITNTSGQSATLNGARVELRDIGATYAYDFTGGTIAAQASKTVGDGTVDYALALNLDGRRAAAVLLCAASPCSASTVLDAFTFEGGGVPPALPSGVSVNAPVLGIDGDNENVEDFYRVQYAGAAPTFSSCDWTTAPKQPIFAESFECGLSRWTVRTGGAFTTEAAVSPDGSATVVRQTSGSINASTGMAFTFPAAVFPTHIEYWMHGGNRTFLCNTMDACAIGATIYWDYKGNMCWVGAELNCLDTPVEDWDLIELDNINWTAGTLSVRVNGTSVMASSAGNRPKFGTTWVTGSGLRTIVLTGGAGTWDRIRMW